MNTTTTPELMQRHGFPMGGEPSIAVDFVDTVYRDSPATTVDLLAGSDTAWWRLQASRLVNGDRPDHGKTVRLRETLRAAFDDVMSGRTPDDETLRALNEVVELVPTTCELHNVGGALTVETRWHVQPGGDANLSAIARDGMALLLDRGRSDRLRRCANPACLMIFVAENSKRIWCSANGCGNRARASRHYYRHHAAGSADAA